eukprot:CAMPEP_0113876180 /NCGR_PEP_ID=MMETSP0780_2-20120614/5346_1 /TAXON_ID=652834 /ORGANISM="Palpitomonas bilix" /LENGTH=1197 /DNA_ID=CAMNT_0000862235 /DNA_START=94 /DNA_END=3688 /DNA_ORIENTATION=- /assembly_acc=CAM_ASM_000599
MRRGGKQSQASKRSEPSGAVQSDLVYQLKNFTGLDGDEARTLLQKHNWDVQVAANAFFTHQDPEPSGRGGGGRKGARQGSGSGSAYSSGGSVQQEGGRYADVQYGRSISGGSYPYENASAGAAGASMYGGTSGGSDYYGEHARGGNQGFQGDRGYYQGSGAAAAGAGYNQGGASGYGYSQGGAAAGGRYNQDAASDYYNQDGAAAVRGEYNQRGGATGYVHRTDGTVADGFVQGESPTVHVPGRHSGEVGGTGANMGTTGQREMEAAVANSKVDAYKKVATTPTQLMRQKGVPVGLQNIGNTCYLNTVLQSFFTFKPFVEIVQHIDVEGRNIEGVRFWKALQFVFKMMESSSRAFVNPKRLALELGIPVHDDFQGTESQQAAVIGGEQDVDEFMRSFLEKVEQVLKQVDAAKSHELEELTNGKCKSYSFGRMPGENTYVSLSMLRREMEKPSFDGTLPGFEEAEGAMKAEGGKGQIIRVIEDPHALDEQAHKLNPFVANIDSGTLIDSIRDHFFITQVDDYKIGERPVPLTRCVVVESLPAILPITIPRASYDQTRGMLVKRHDPFEFPEVLHLSAFSRKSVEELLSVSAYLEKLKNEKRDKEQSIEQLANHAFANIDKNTSTVLESLATFARTQGPILGENDEDAQQRFAELGNLASYVKGKVNERVARIKDEIKKVEEEYEKVLIGDEKDVYELHTVMIHRGNEATTGHYWSYVKDTTNKWWCFNDDEVKPSTSRQVLSDGYGGDGTKSAYCLIYVRRDVWEKKCTTVGSLPCPPSVKLEVDEENRKFDEELARELGTSPSAINDIIQKQKRRLTRVKMDTLEEEQQAAIGALSRDSVRVGGSAAERNENGQMITMGLSKAKRSSIFIVSHYAFLSLFDRRYVNYAAAERTLDESMPTWRQYAEDAAQLEEEARAVVQEKRDMGRVRRAEDVLQDVAKIKVINNQLKAELGVDSKDVIAPPDDIAKAVADTKVAYSGFVFACSLFCHGCARLAMDGPIDWSTAIEEGEVEKTVSLLRRVSAIMKKNLQLTTMPLLECIIQGPLRAIMSAVLETASEVVLTPGQEELGRKVVGRAIAIMGLQSSIFPLEGKSSMQQLTEMLKVEGVEGPYYGFISMASKVYKNANEEAVSTAERSRMNDIEDMGAEKWAEVLKGENCKDIAANFVGVEQALAAEEERGKGGRSDKAEVGVFLSRLF